MADTAAGEADRRTGRSVAPRTVRTGTPGTSRHANDDRRADRVAVVHDQSQTTLVVAALFVVAACVAAALDHKPGHWLALHLFLLGGVLTAISGATQLLAVPWCSSPAPRSWIVRTQQVTLAVGVILLAAARERHWPTPWAAIAGTAILVALVMLAGLLVTIRQTGPKDRFRPAIDGYVVAILLGLAGSYAGILMATGSIDGTRYAWVRSAHFSTNLLGLVGIVIATTLPYMLATQARMKMSRRATPLAVRSMVAALAVATLLAGFGMLYEHPGIAGVGYVVYVIALACSVSLHPMLGAKQIRWAGWRIAHVAAGALWWAGCVVAMAVNAFADKPIPETVLLVLVIGGYAQILVGSLAYFAPVLRGGGRKGLSAGFRLTRSLPGLIAANAAVVGILVHAGWVVAVGLGVWVLDGTVRTIMLATTDPAREGDGEDGTATTARAGT